MTFDLNNADHKKALIELLFQLADDDFLHAFRGSEWLGLAPHIEEDVAFSSINQDTMGHAGMYFRLLGELGAGTANDIAHLRNPEDYRNAIILELVNGPGEYLDKPEYDWAFTVVRHLFYDLAKNIRLTSLRTSTYEPLAQSAAKILTEQPYHLHHWQTWFLQLMNSTDEARLKMETAIERVWKDFGGVISLGEHGEEITACGLIKSENEIMEIFMKEINAIVAKADYKVDSYPGMSSGNGRNGEHTDDLRQAISTFSEVYKSDPKTAW